MAWIIAAVIAVPVVAILWMSALLVSEVFATSPSRAAAIAALRDPRVAPIEPYRTVIAVWLWLSRAA